MRIFKDAMEMIREVERDLFEMGITVKSHSMQDKNVENNEDYVTKELQAYGFQIKLSEKDRLDEMVEYMKGNLEWARADFKERISPELVNPGEAYKLREVWEEFVHDGKFSYTYNERYRTQLPVIIEELRHRPNTRQAILTMYDKHEDLPNLGGKARIPCSLTYQFMIRNGKLDCVYNMRSCDFLTHFCHDVWLTVELQKYIADSLNLNPGYYSQFIGSLHAYQKDLKSRNIF